MAKLGIPRATFERHKNLLLQRITQVRTTMSLNRQDPEYVRELGEALKAHQQELQELNQMLVLPHGPALSAEVERFNRVYSAQLRDSE